MSTTLGIDSEGFEIIREQIRSLPWAIEDVVNEVLHNEGGTLIQNAIRNLIPESGRQWKGKPAPAKSGNSLMATNSNLAVTVRSTKKYRYLYFPDDGTNTRSHAGDQQFFLRGAESVTDEIVDKIIDKVWILIKEGD